MTLMNITCHTSCYQYQRTEKGNCKAGGKSWVVLSQMKTTREKSYLRGTMLKCLLVGNSTEK